MSKFVPYGPINQPLSTDLLLVIYLYENPSLYIVLHAMQANCIFYGARKRNGGAVRMLSVMRFVAKYYGTPFLPVEKKNSDQFFLLSYCILYIYLIAI